MKKTILISSVLFFVLASHTFCNGSTWWHYYTIDPPCPTILDPSVTIGFGGMWGNTCILSISNVSVDGDSIYFTVIVIPIVNPPCLPDGAYNEETIPMSMLIPGGTHSLYVRLRDGGGQVIEPYELVTTFDVRMYPGTITVGPGGSGAGYDYGTIQDGINAAVNDDTVLVADGTYTGTGNKDLDFGGKAITLKSENGPESCIIDCQGSGRGFYFHSNEDANSVLDGITITNGSAGSGGGIYCSSSGPTIRNCIFVNNSATGITHGSGGGGMKNNSGSPTVIGCKFIGNSAAGGEAGSGGGGISNNNGNLVLINCIFSGNSSGHYGGAIFNNSNPKITNCTFSNNSATKDGGGILTYISGAKPKLTNCIFWGNTDRGGTDEGAQIHFGNPVVNYSCIQGLTGGLGGTGNIGNDPCFVDVDGVDNIAGTLDDDLHLPFDSLCIDAGSTIWPDLLPEKDLDGNFRQADGDDDGVVAVDMGVYEYGTVDTPLISAQPAQFEFITPDNESDMPAQTLFIWNLGIDTLNWQISEDCPWLSVAPLSGASTGEFNEVDLTVDASGMLPGDHNCTLIVSDEQAANSPVTVLLTLRIGGVERLVPSEYPTIQTAIDAAIDGDIIIVEPNTYTGSGNKEIDFKGKAITLRSESGPESCIIDCQNSGRGFYFHSNEDANSVLEGFTITNGYRYKGGGIFCQGSSPTITNCIIRGNTAYDMMMPGAGAGIYNTNSSPIISNCVISNNTAYTDTGSTDWSQGGGMFNITSNPTIINCTFTENSANSVVGAFGGGIFNSSSNPTIINCTFTGNSVNSMGGWAYGGGMYNSNSSPNLVNCIFWGNSTDGFNSTSEGSGETEQIDGGSPVVNYSCIQDWTGALGGIGNIDADPCFVDPCDSDYHLKSEGWRWDKYMVHGSYWKGDYVTSRCIDAGNPGSPLADELLTIPDDPTHDWGQNLRINMGAYGGTAQASMPPYDWALLADLTNDGTVNFEDFAGQATDWLETENKQPGDLNRDGTVDINDVALFVDDWLKQTSWAP